MVVGLSASSQHAQFLFDQFKDTSLRRRYAFALVGEQSSGVNDIPIRLSLLVPPFAGIVVAKTIQKSVPKRAVPLNECRLHSAYHLGSNMLADHKATPEIRQMQIFHNVDTASVLVYATPQFTGLAYLRVGNAGLPPAFRDSLPDVDWIVVRKAVEFPVLPVNTACAGVVKGIDTRFEERFRRRMHRSAIDKMCQSHFRLQRRGS